jgi:hypothetical protein
MHKKYNQEKTRLFRFSTAFLVLIAVSMYTSVAAAEQVEFELTMTYSGTSPQKATPPPWITAIFDDDSLADAVTLTLTATNLSDTEFVGGWYFNLDPACEPEELVFSNPIKNGSFDDPTIETGINKFKANGDGFYDILFSFETADGAMDHRFNASDSAVYTISSNTDPLTASSFNFISYPDGGQGEYPTAAHVQGINGTSGWVTTPEPASICLLGLGGLALLKKRRA